MAEDYIMWKPQIMLDQECDRLRLQHFMWKDVWQSNFSAPVEGILTSKGTKVLDVG